MQNKININYKGKAFTLLNALIEGENKLSKKLGLCKLTNSVG